MKQVWLIVASAALLTLGVILYVQRKIDPPVETIVASSLQSLHEQNRLSAFAARFVTVVTSSKARFGLSAEKTLIIPALVRYEVDLAKLKQTDLKWDAEAKLLRITLPPIEMSGPEFDLAATREYQSGAVLLTLTDVERLLDQENRAKAKADLLQQARAAPMLKLARDATSRAVASSFALPLRAAGIEAGVRVEFGPS
jgi:Protein of unknown function (DUF4230)